MSIVGQPRRLSGQAERLPYNVGSWLPDYFFGPISSVPDNNCWKSGRLRSGSRLDQFSNEQWKLDARQEWRANNEAFSPHLQALPHALQSALATN
jgi:hypothetical protein